LIQYTADGFLKRGETAAHSDSHDDVNRFDTTVLVREAFLESGVAKSLGDLIELGNLPPQA
jgi:hypothetical protein